MVVLTADVFQLFIKNTRYVRKKSVKSDVSYYVNGAIADTPNSQPAAPHHVQKRQRSMVDTARDEGRLCLYESWSSTATALVKSLYL